MISEPLEDPSNPKAEREVRPTEPLRTLNGKTSPRQRSQAASADALDRTEDRTEDQAVDEAGEESFPASDPPTWTLGRTVERKR
jgi:hypothetical protein